MYQAEDARKMSMLYSKLKNVIEEMDRKIEESVKEGLFETSVSFFTKPDDELIETMIEKLELYGYKAKFEPAKPLPNGCPSDQWDFNSYLHIRWDNK